MKKNVSRVFCWVVLVILIFIAFEPGGLVSSKSMSSACWDINPPFGFYNDWKVSNGYNSGPCHYKVQTNTGQCGTGDQYYSFDLVPANGSNAGEKPIYSPVAGKVLYTFPIMGGDGGRGVKILTNDGYTIHLYHLMNMDSKIKANAIVTYNQYIGQVFNNYPFGNHLHLHISKGNVSIPIHMVGFKYYDKGTINQWKGRILRQTKIYVGQNFTGGDIKLGCQYQTPDLSCVNNQVSSLEINSGCSITLYDYKYYKGASQTFSMNIANLAEYGWDNRASSLKFTCSSN